MTDIADGKEVMNVIDGPTDRVLIIVLDSLGIGEALDAADYNDEGSNTIVHLAEACGGLKVPNMQRLGLGNITEISGVPAEKYPIGYYGKMREQSKGKDTTCGHWEIAGLVTTKKFPTYPDAFPADLISEFERRIGCPVLGNEVASGTEIIQRLGAEHIRTHYPIVYTSADSVFQIAAHEEIIPPEKLYEICRIARDLLQGDHGVGRVIARPFIGKEGKFVRTGNRHDFSLPPTGTTVLDLLQEKGFLTAGVGKIGDIFAQRGLQISQPTKSNQQGIDVTVQFLRELKGPGLIFTNLVEFDSNYGHRNDAIGYAKALQEFDQRLPEIIRAMHEDDIMIITADHGCDPTTLSTDHSREYVPLLVYGKNLTGGSDLGIRGTFADAAMTIADLFGFREYAAERLSAGSSFAGLLKRTK